MRSNLFELANGGGDGCLESYKFREKLEREKANYFKEAVVVPASNRMFQKLICKQKIRGKSNNSSALHTWNSHALLNVLKSGMLTKDDVLEQDVDTGKNLLMLSIHLNESHEMIQLFIDVGGYESLSQVDKSNNPAFLYALDGNVPDSIKKICIDMAEDKICFSELEIDLYEKICYSALRDNSSHDFIKLLLDKMTQKTFFERDDSNNFKLLYNAVFYGASLQTVRLILQKVDEDKINLIDFINNYYDIIWDESIGVQKEFDVEQLSVQNRIYMSIFAQIIDDNKSYNSRESLIEL